MNLVYKNLCIRNAEAGDAEQLCLWWNDGEVMAHAGFPNGLNETPEKFGKALPPIMTKPIVAISLNWMVSR